MKSCTTYAFSNLRKKRHAANYSMMRSRIPCRGEDQTIDLEISGPTLQLQLCHSRPLSVFFFYIKWLNKGQIHQKQALHQTKRTTCLFCTVGSPSTPLLRSLIRLLDIFRYIFGSLKGFNGVIHSQLRKALNLLGLVVNGTLPSLKYGLKSSTGKVKFPFLWPECNWKELLILYH